MKPKLASKRDLEHTASSTEIREKLAYPQSTAEKERSWHRAPPRRYKEQCRRNITPLLAVAEWAKPT